MNPNSTPREFTDEALDKKFSFSFTRKQLVVILNALAPMQMALGELRTKVLLDVMDEINRAAFNALTDSDYKETGPAKVAPPAPDVAVN